VGYFHISLVFTFESSLTSIELNEHLKKVLTGTRPFRLTLQEIVKIDKHTIKAFVVISIK